MATSRRRSTNPTPLDIHRQPRVFFPQPVSGQVERDPEDVHYRSLDCSVDGRVGCNFSTSEAFEHNFFTQRFPGAFSRVPLDVLLRSSVCFVNPGRNLEGYTCISSRYNSESRSLHRAGVTREGETKKRLKSCTAAMMNVRHDR